MNQRPDLRRSGSSGSDASSFYSVSSRSSGVAESACSVWSSSESDSFVWRDDPYGFDGIGGAVTRFVDDRDDKRKRFASHILSGPFAQYYKKQRQGCGRSGRSAGSSRSTPRPMANPGRGGMPNFAPPPRPGPAGPPFQQPQFHQQQFHPQNFGGRQPGPPPPPPPPIRPVSANPGFEGGFIQLGGNGGPPPPPQQHDPVWGNGGGYGPEEEMYD